MLIDFMYTCVSTLQYRGLDCVLYLDKEDFEGRMRMTSIELRNDLLR
jgi:hypothetical protein